MASKTIKARFRNGVIEPLEKVEFKEGEEFTLIIVMNPHPSALRSQRKSAGYSSSYRKEQRAV